MMDCYVFQEEPTDRAYEDLIRSCCALASRLLLVVRDPHIDPGAEILKLLERLRPFLLNSDLRKEWPGTILLADEATVYTYGVTNELGDLLCDLKRRLFDWVHPDAPEDPCFMRDNGQAVLVTISHENDGYLALTEDESRMIASRFPVLTAILRKDD